MLSQYRLLFDMQTILWLLHLQRVLELWIALIVIAISMIPSHLINCWVTNPKAALEAVEAA